jgi:Xaa-Pro aminopeptidase
MDSSMIAPRHGFDVAEFEGRFARAQALMTAHELDALFLTTAPNIRYFTGFATQFWESPTRPWYLLVPRRGRPVAIIPEIGEPAMARTWIEDFRTWPAPRPADDGVSLLTAAMNEIDRGFGRIGAELGRESVVRMPIIELDQVRKGLRGTAIVNGSPCMREIRMVKTAAEIARIRHICQIVSAGFEALPAKLRVGDTEAEACRKLRIDVAERGADATPFMPGVSGPGGYSQIIVGPTDRVIGPGDILFIDTGCTYDGYFSDFDRNFAFGHLDDAARRAHETVWDATEAGIKAAVPGATTTDVWRAQMAVVERAGSIRNNVGRMGHGLGLQLTEPPSNMPGDDTKIVPGMVLTIEPGMEYAPGKMIVHEENVVIADSGAELLTRRAPREMPIITA